MGTRLPANLWLAHVEDKCLEQIVNLASLPFAFKHIAIMPDAHAGKGMPIGGVLATHGVIVPNAVGVDIGCGMCAMKTNLKASALERKNLAHVMRHIRAFQGELGIIPGSMGTKSYIVEGLGNPLSFMSCSHGAGRRMSRSAAFKTLSLEEECRRMDQQGIIHGMRASGLDEAPGAYKDINEVIALQGDLVKPLVELVPLAVIKGD